MSKPKHTPGPWKRVPGTKTKLSRPDGTMVYIEIGQTRLASIDLCGTDPNYSIHEANANSRVMAAAPELLEGLEGLCAHLKQDKVLDFEPERLKAYELARKAIAKAKGENNG